MDILDYVKLVAKEEALEEAKKEVKKEVMEEVMEEALTEANIKVVNNLIANAEFSDERIASIVGVSVAFVMEVRQKKK